MQRVKTSNWFAYKQIACNASNYPLGILP